MAPAALARAGFPARRRSTALRPRKEPLALACLAVLLLASALLSLGAGAVAIPLGRVLATLVGAASADPGDALVLFQIRLPRLLLGGLVGAALAVSGALMQGLFRNPLADPGLVGVSAGAALAAAVTIVLGDALLAPLVGRLPFSALPIGAFSGGLLTTLALYRIATRGGAHIGRHGFVGIVVPHVPRLAVGPDHRLLLPASALLGAALLIAADSVARTLLAPAELPIGILTAVIGAPFFLWLLLRRERGAALA